MKLTGKLRAMAALVTLLIVLPALAACDMGNSGAANGAMLKAAAKNMRDLKSYYMDVDYTQAAEGGDNYHIEFKGKVDRAGDKFDGMTTLSGRPNRVIGIGEDTYFLDIADADADITNIRPHAKMATGYISGSGDFETAFEYLEKMWDTMTDAEIDNAKDKLKEGNPATEDIGGVATRHIVVNIEDLTNMKVSMGQGNADFNYIYKGKLDIWVNTEGQQYVHRLTIDGQARSGDHPAKGSLTWSRFNEEFTIDTPVMEDTP